MQDASDGPSQHRSASRSGVDARICISVALPEFQIEETGTSTFHWQVRLACFLHLCWYGACVTQVSSDSVCASRPTQRSRSPAPQSSSDWGSSDAMQASNSGDWWSSQNSHPVIVG